MGYCVHFSFSCIYKDRVFWQNVCNISVTQVEWEKMEWLQARTPIVRYHICLWSAWWNFCCVCFWALIVGCCSREASRVMAEHNWELKYGRVLQYCHFLNYSTNEDKPLINKLNLLFLVLTLWASVLIMLLVIWFISMYNFSTIKRSWKILRIGEALVCLGWA